MRFALGVLAFAALAAVSPATIQTYRVTGTFDAADGDFEGLVGTSFTFDLAYDTEAPNLGDEFSAAYELSSVGLTTSLGSAAGYGAAVVDLDPEQGTMGFGATEAQGENDFLSYGLALGELPPQSGALPQNLTAVAAQGTSTFYMIGAYGNPNTSPGVLGIPGVGTAFASRVSVQAVPEPAALAAMAVGAVGLIRRRRTAR